MNYQQTLDYMYARLPMFSRVGGQAIKAGFTNIIALCEALGQPHTHGRFVHIAGTNGKGSVSHMLASVLQSAGYKTGLYTSPHLKDFRERIRINGEMISEQEVVDFIQQIQPAIEKIQPSFFELTVAMAFDHFAKQGVDIAVIETGLGGRLDSTNIINPVLSVITNIGYDHMQLLGNTLPEIAAEKAGIIKRATPVVIGEKAAVTEPVFKARAAAEAAPLFFAADRWQVAGWEQGDYELLVEVAEKNKTDHKMYRLDLTGQYQTKNLLTLLESCYHLNQSGFHISGTALENGLQHVKKQTGLHGRWETVHLGPRVVLDVAHNESGMRELLNQLEVTSYHQLHIVLGMVKDKDIDAVLDMLPLNALYYFTNATVPRAMSGTDLQSRALLKGLQGHVYEEVNEALAAAKARAHADDLVLVCGSVFLVGEVQW